MRLIVGLGNPGAEYDLSRHNLGFMVIDKLASQSSVQVKTRECHALTGRGEIEGSVVKLIKPQTYMNLSGEAVSCLLRKHGFEEQWQDHLIVVSDDLALPLGKIRIRERGSAGGHNGLQSVITALGSSEFVRLRIGIQPEHEIEDSKRFVLDRFSHGDQEIVDEAVEQSASAIRAILRDGVLQAMTQYNA